MTLAAIFDCEGARMSADERAFFRDADPWGFIVFARHGESPDALRAHCDELREAVGRDAPILIDQEGGRVVRLKPPVWPAHPAPAIFGELYRLDPSKAIEASRLNGYLLGRMVSDCGADVDCVPMVDVPQPDADPTVIGDRALAKHPDIISALAAAQIDGLKDGGALPVVKHIPGHGRGLCDGHFELPRVSSPREDLLEIDFAPFRALRDEGMAMTAHIVYEAFDPDRAATLSPTIIQDVIRAQIGFDGLLMTDDLKMKALGGPIAQRVTDSYDAGCDIALCCNFTMAEKKEATRAARRLAGRPAERAEQALAQKRAHPAGDVPANLDEGYAVLEALLKPVAPSV